MTYSGNIGIWGLAAHLPPAIRRNDWWPAELVEQWRQQRTRVVRRPEHQQLGDGARRLLEVAAQYADDPFEGARERRVMADDVRPTDMQAAAARAAVERAGVDPADIDFLLVDSTTPDYLLVPDGCRLQVLLGLTRSRLFTLQTSAAQNAFLQHLALGESMIRGGAFRLGLVIQTSVMSRHVRREDPFSPWFGDACTAAVIGPVADGRGILAHEHGTDGRVHGGLVMGVPDHQWYDDGRVVVYIADRDKVSAMFLSMAGEVDVLVERALGRAGVRRDQVRFFAAHQGTAWIGAAFQSHLGVDAAERVDTFPWAASVAGCNLPLILDTAVREGRLHDGDLVLGFSGAVGQTVGALVLRWGR
jgi:3-oxoacyl-[acyl-carrier-protein] synthase III